MGSEQVEVRKIGDGLEQAFYGGCHLNVNHGRFGKGMRAEAYLVGDVPACGGHVGLGLFCLECDNYLQNVKRESQESGAEVLETISDEPDKPARAA